jgi:EAL and modified HD-GYP domain-containing signal transduction protein
LIPITTAQASLESLCAPTPKQVFIGRQPIYGRNLDLVAYELLFRNDDSNRANVSDGDSATFTVMLNALVEVGLHRLVGDKLAFINLTRNSVLCEYATLFPKHQVVMEVLEDVVVDEELLALVKRFHNDGYRIALDDFVERDDLVPLTQLAHIIKVDIQALGRDTIEDYVRAHHRMELLAEKVETKEEYEYCRALGFKYFQGYFLDRPQILRVVQVPTCQQTVLKCLMDLHSDELSHAQLAATISCDPFLTYRLLRAVCGRSGWNAITTVEDAVRLMGLDALRRWITLLSISGLDDADHSELVDGMALGFACRELGERWFKPLASAIHMCGLLMVMPQALGMDMSKLLRSLDLREDILDAIEGTGPIAVLLKDAHAAHLGLPLPHRSLEDQKIIASALAHGQAQARLARLNLGI